MKIKIKNIIGLAGISVKENKKAQKFSHVFSYVVLAALVAVLVSVITEATTLEHENFYFSLVIWLVFTVEYLTSLYLVDDKAFYIKTNWLNLVIVLLTIPWFAFGGNWAAIFRSLRLLLFIKIFEQVFVDIILILKRNSFGTILLVALGFTIVSGGVFSSLEDVDFKKGLWYTLVTITTVGYGDVVPMTPEGKIFGTILIMFGVVLFSIVVANISAFLVGSDQKKVERQLLHVLETNEMHIEAQNALNEKRMERLLLDITHRLNILEQNINNRRTEELEEKLMILEAKRAEENALLQEHILKGQQKIILLMEEIKQLSR